MKSVCIKIIAVNIPFWRDLLSLRDGVVLVVLHNHPSTRTFSEKDIRLFIQQENMEYIVTESNQGQLHYIKKEENFNAQKAGMLYNKINDYSGCVIDEEAIRKSREKNRALVASLGDEFRDLKKLMNV